MNTPRILIAGTGSSVGKTTIATGIMKSLNYKGLKVQPFKVGPDFIDPSYHSIATNRPSRNLDSFLMSEAQIRWSFSHASKNSDIAIIEGVRGLYEGLNAISDIGSTAHIAKILKAPIILVIDIRGITKSAAAYILGFKQLDPDVNIAGIILNKFSTRKHAEKTVRAIEKYTKIPVIGTIPNEMEQVLQQRHLGLIPMAEFKGKQEIITNMGGLINENVDIEQILDIANKTEEIKEVKEPLWNKNEELSKQRIRIGIAKDSAFNFYYQDNLDAFSENGAKLIEFSPVKGETLPEADCFLIGGGFPEIYSQEISQNTNFLKDLKNTVMENLPVYAECGGLMILSSKLVTTTGDKYQFANIIPSNIIMMTQRQGLSYVEGITTKNHPFLPPNSLIKGHEFHYSKLNEISNTIFGYKIRRGKGIDGSNDGICINNTLASFLHIHIASNPNFAIDFLKLAFKRKD
ncbi:MAG: Ni-sirohydrochlorin a,c-diamide synthase [Candidatus Helarchaeota archaeon]|nr:Ni-sirohydrochlorin a,c-diamide synthase [Candidatus Helarchaeota archaeon]